MIHLQQWTENFEDSFVTDARCKMWGVSGVCRCTSIASQMLIAISHGPFRHLVRQQCHLGAFQSSASGGQGWCSFPHLLPTPFVTSSGRAGQNSPHGPLPIARFARNKITRFSSQVSYSALCWEWFLGPLGGQLHASGDNQARLIVWSVP